MESANTNANALLWEVSAFEFILVTVILGGAAAWMTGRALAQSWGSNWVLGFYIVLLTAAVRFIHFSLYGGTLLTIQYYLIDLVVLLGIAFAAKRYVRAGQMASQYRFLFDRSGPFGWRNR
ncbi:DUF6867 family protein [Pseudohoeflea coraliihabitans]|uniref:DUF6867 domain-containing protein n=1 Tax=Pseudohoeflea coraliihabitans TaxID=2860393 RepID=A0ABS6WQG9_9HYPH|nr:hypothetical protein [Pseudohoeflea sp. DP4N28-3]MBW3097305.1 hypothetical protein [Pseudohoeflea sp. DP4N28-3]